ncbi:MAG: hypothetical protein LBM64_05430 [Deltaproteobacteria bacterium]|jgi:hypothetical protein|nr:hypothetical protein [Deltaproteobacteria bacterium]
MPVYVINCDLNTSEQEKQINAAIKDLSGGSWCRIFDSAWLVVHNGPSAAIYDRLAPFMDELDRLFVINVGADYKSRLNSGPSGWVKKVLG